MAQSMQSDSTQYHTIEPKTDEHFVEEEILYELAQPSRKRSWTSTILLQAFALLWLVPIAALLWLNAIEYIVGASAWCPGGKCYREMFSVNATQRALELNKHDSNILGGLQFVAKALEAWFIFICATLLYLVTMFFASQPEGLPISYLTKSLNFATPVGLADLLPSFRRSGSRGVIQSRRTLQRHAVWLLVLLSVFLFALCNLMGPATAILVLPELKWKDTPLVDLKNMTSLNSAAAPRDNPNDWFYRFTEECTEVEYQALNFTCTMYPFGQSLDAWFETYRATTGWLGMATQSGMTFTMNTTASEGVTSKSDDAQLAWWVPSRQIVATLQDDLEMIQFISNGNTSREVAKYYEDYLFLDDPYETYTPYNNSLELEIQRSGPILGAVTHLWLDSYQPPQKGFSFRNVIAVGDLTVICYEGYTLTSFQTDARDGSQRKFTKCTRTSEPSTWNRFYIQGRYTDDGQRGATAMATIISSDTTIFLENGLPPPWFDQKCLVQGSNFTDCDWARLFAEEPDELTANRTKNMVTIEYSLAALTDTNGTSEVLLAVDFAAYAGFTNFSLNVSPMGNPARLVRVESLPTADTVTPIYINPIWILAGWSADSYGYVNPNRPTANLLMFVLEELLMNQDLGYANPNIVDWDLDAVTILPIMQSLSLIDFTNGSWNQALFEAHPEGLEHRMLHRHARMFVWSYGFKSRTSRLGAVVAIAGCVVVLAQGVLGFVDRRRYRTPTQLLVAALEHVPRGEFVGRDHSDSSIGRVELRVMDDDTRAGKFSFHRPH